MRLYLGTNQIVDISPLSGLTNLTWLYLDENEVVDVSPLQRLTNLTWLYLDENAIVDISPLSGLSNLSRVCLRNNDIADIRALVANNGLNTGDLVNIRGNSLDLTPGSPDMLAIEALLGQGVRVDFDLQN